MPNKLSSHVAMVIRIGFVRNLMQVLRREDARQSGGEEKVAK
jgi:hypothetical protein